jgi:asparagine synthase (glutamine-hydrolysing)
MPSISGWINQGQERSSTLRQRVAAPPSEHPAENYAQFTSPQVGMNVWTAPGVPASDALFQSASGEPYLVCACDSEISNTVEIAAELRTRGVALKSTATAELVGKLVACLGERAFGRLHGGFSCAVWDGEILWLAVDRTGMKRLSYSVQPDQLLRFGSRPDWAARENVEISPIAVYQYLNLGFIPSPESVYRGTSKLPAGSFLRLSAGNSSVESYWQMKYPEDLTGSVASMGQEFRLQIQEAVRRTVGCLDADQIGCYLSGGTDSSTVLGMAARVLGRGPQAFSIGFSDETFDELFYARTAARHFEAPLHESIVGADDCWRFLNKLVRAFDEPFGNSSAVGGFACAEMAADHHVPVMFAGDGGDELFGGNDRYRKDSIYQRLHAIPLFLFQNGITEALWKLFPDSSTAVRLKKILFRATLDNPERFYLEDCLSADLNSNFISQELSASTASVDRPLQLMKNHFAKVDAKSELNRLLFLDLKFTIAENDLVKVRQTASANGVRVRFPMLDSGLVDFSGRLPAGMKLRGQQLRYLFKQALTGFLPQEIIKKQKHGFGVPVSVWFREDARFRGLLLDIVNDRKTQQRGYFRPEALQRIADEHLRGVFDWGGLLWSVLMLELWHRESVSDVVHSDEVAFSRT